jgi:hypothetical protein
MATKIKREVTTKVQKQAKPTTPKAPKAIRTVKAATSWGAMAHSLAKTVTPLPAAPINLPMAPQLRAWSLPGIDW